MEALKPGKIVLVAGLYCAGKTTLIGSVLRQMPELAYIPTYTTRDPRPEEARNGTHEYVFVSQTEYDRLSQTPGWDHTLLRGVSYGSDAAKVSQEAAVGRSFIVVTTMYPEQIREMRGMYRDQTVLVLLDTDFDTCQQRIMLPDSGRSQRYLNDPAQSPEQASLVRDLADYIYDPVGSLAEDQAAFQAFIRRILAANSGN
jgi:guanylate kinase